MTLAPSSGQWLDSHPPIYPLDRANVVMKSNKLIVQRTINAVKDLRLLLFSS